MGWRRDTKEINQHHPFGLIGILIFAAAFSKFNFLKIVSTALLLAGASCISGAFLGFLFGIPRTGQVEDDNSGTTAGSEKNGASHAYRPNTNLEQISDWLTKILVGVGLTQINEIGIWFSNVLKFLTPHWGQSRPGFFYYYIFFSQWVYPGFFMEPFIYGRSDYESGKGSAEGRNRKRSPEQDR